MVPVLGQEGSDATSTIIARVLGLRALGDDFFETLIQPGAAAQTADSYLIRRNERLVEYLTPLGDGSRPLTKRLALNTDDLIDVAALSDPGQFHIGKDYAGHEVFAVSRQIPGADWVLVHKIDRAEALAEANAQRGALLAGLVLVIVTLSAAFIIVWRYASSLRAEEAARRYKESSERNEALSRFLDIMMDNQPHPIYVTDASGQLIFANQRMAELTQVPKEELAGRSLLGMLGQEKGQRYLEINRQVIASETPRNELSHFPLGHGEEQLWRSYHAPLPAMGDRPPAALTSIEDLTDLLRERARREHNTRQLLETLIGLVDERDPDAAHQSLYTAWLARHIAEDCGLNDSEVEAMVQAARLVNIGKIRIPRALLTKEGSLSEDEFQVVRQALDEGPNLLKHIAFDGPVLEILRQINERVDGGGRPRGLKGDQILLGAQIVALANTFVALVSPRAFRNGKTIDEAETILLNEIGQRFDKRVVLSLLNYLNNKGGRQAWARMTQSDES